MINMSIYEKFELLTIVLVIAHLLNNTAFYAVMLPVHSAMLSLRKRAGVIASQSGPANPSLRLRPWHTTGRSGEN